MLPLGPTWLFVPGDRPDRFDKALASGADQVILDLEDGVSPVRKPQARAEIRRWFEHGGRGWIRVNDSDSADYPADIHLLESLVGIEGVVLPKAESASQVQTLTRQLGDLRVMALIETAKGIRAAFDIADQGPVDVLGFGGLDYAVSVGSDSSDVSLLYARSVVVAAAAAGSCSSVADGVSVTLRDDELIAGDAARARALGFNAKLCVHPAQLGPTRRGLAPTAAQLAWAKGILRRSASSGAVAVDGTMVDKPVRERAAAVLRAAEYGSRFPTVMP